MLESRYGCCSGGTRRRRHRGATVQPGQGVFPEAGFERHQATARRVLPRRRGWADAGLLAGPPDAFAALPRRHRRRGDLPEADTAAPSRLPGDLPGDVSVGKDRRRAEGDSPGRHRVGCADGHDHPASVAGALPGYRAPRRAAYRPGSAAGYRFRGSTSRRRRRVAATARRARASRFSQDVGRSRRPRVPADQNRLGFHRGAPCRYRAGPRGGASCTGCGDDVVVEGRTGRAHLHRLQSERPRPYVRVGLLGAAHCDRDGVDAADMGRAGKRKPRRLHHRDRGRSGGPPRRPVGRYRLDRPVDCAAAGHGRGR